jgi:hypothetical protein
LEQLEEDRRQSAAAASSDEEQDWRGVEGEEFLADSPASEQILRKLSEAESMLARKGTFHSERVLNDL